MQRSMHKIILKKLPRSICSFVLLLAALFVLPVLNTACTAERKPSVVSVESNVPDDSPAIDPYLVYAYSEAARIAASLDSRKLASQVIMAGVDGKGYLNRDMQALFDEYPTGGIMLFRFNLDTPTGEIQNFLAETTYLIASRLAVRLRDFPRPERAPLIMETGALNADELWKGRIGEIWKEPVMEPGERRIMEICSSRVFGLRPFVAVDHEGGNVRRFRRGVADLPAASHYMASNDLPDTAIAKIEADNFRTGSILFDLGINMNLAPVAEFLNAHNSEFLGSRSYSDDPVFTAAAAAACMRGMERAGLLCAVKHFPGSAGQDPHLFSAAIHDSIDELDVLISPFASLIGEGQVRALMVSHTLVPARDTEHIASLSAAVMQGWLRDELGYTGLIICDDFTMAAGRQAVSGSAAVPAHVAAAVNSLIAGADMVMVWPHDIRRTHRAILAALDNGSLAIERLQEAAGRIVFEKIRMGLLDDRQE